LQLSYAGHAVADLSMQFLHEGRPPVVRDARYEPPPLAPWHLPPGVGRDPGEVLRKILGSLNVASKEWVIRQYDHEVQGGSVVKPLVGARNDGPSDAAVLRPVLSARRGLVVSCGMNPRYGDLDTYDMAASAIDEAIRNNVAVGADPQRIAILDNFCWGYTDRPETLGSLVRAALACHDLALALGTPFISGKDSLNNEFSYRDEQGQRRTIAIPASLLISALGQVPDVRQCVTMDLKEPGSVLFQIGRTRDELGGSHYARLRGDSGGNVPQVDAPLAKRVFHTLHQAIRTGLVRSCHDLSEGGLAVAVAEMAFAGGWGAQVDISAVDHALDHLDEPLQTIARLFSESNTRFVCEVAPPQAQAFETLMRDHEVPCARIGTVQTTRQLTMTAGNGSGAPRTLVDLPIAQLKQAWQRPLQWH
jgi:phosphoribosylformylglycinamidine synthase